MKIQLILIVILAIILKSSQEERTNLMDEIEQNLERRLFKQNMVMFEKYVIYQQKKHYKDSLQRKNAQLEFEIIKMVVRNTLKKPTTYEIKKANRMLKMVLKQLKI